MSSSKIFSLDTLNASQPDGPDLEKTQDALSDLPDGGVAAWMTTAGSWLVSFSTFGYVAAFGVYQDYYTRTFMTNKSPSTISWIGSTELGLVFLMGGISGKLFDMGYFHWCIRVGSLLQIFCLFMLSLAHEYQYYQVFLPQAVGLGIAQGLMFLPSVGIISHHFKKRRSLATGIVITGSSVGGIVFPIMLNNIIERVGFAWGVRATAFVTLACLLAGSFMMKTRLPPRTHQETRAALSYRTMLGDRPYMLTMFGLTCIQFGVWFPTFYLQLFAIRQNLDQNLAFYSLAILNAGGILGRTIPNFISDKVGVFRVMIPSSALAGALVFAMFGVRSSAALIVFASLYGFFSGTVFSLFALTVVTHAKNMREVGARLGFVFTINGFAILTGTPISGALLTDAYLWYRPIVFAGVMVLTGAGCLMVSNMMMSRLKQGV